MSATLLLRRLLEQAGGAHESGFVCVLDGDGLEELPAEMPTAAGNYHVHRVDTEVELRHLLWQAKGAPLLGVMPEALARRLPADLLRRARNQRVHALSVSDVLEVILGVRVVGADAPYLQQLALEHIEKLSLAVSRRTVPTVIDRGMLIELLVDASVGESVRGSTAAELLALWVLEPPMWSENVTRLVSEALPRLHGDEGRVLAWALVRPAERMRQLVVHSAVLTVDADTDALPPQAWGPLYQAATEPPLETGRRVLLRTLRRLVEGALVKLADGAADLLEEANKVGRETLPPVVLATSNVLPLAFMTRCHQLAQGAVAGVPISAENIAWLGGHLAASSHRNDVAVLEAMALISRYLDTPTSAPPDVPEQVCAYQRDGAFADRAVAQLRQALAGSARYHGEAGKLLALVRARRDRENEHFAKTLAMGYEAALHRDGVTPLHRVWKRVVAPVWQQAPDTRVYLVVLDGCSYPVFLDLLESLAQDNAFALGIRPGLDGDVIGIPALSPLPTITSHARGALLLGELPNDPLVAETVYRDQTEAKTDRPRFGQNSALGGRTRKLFLKGDLVGKYQDLHLALGDESIEVVAAVFNAIDDQIGSSNTGALVRIEPETIAGFKPSLQAALRAGRRVLLTADHGHTPFVDKSMRVGAGAGAGARYVAMEAHDPVPEGFLEIDLAGLGGPPGRHAFAWRSGAYLGSPQVGFHGGCSLEEMVVPLAWIERNGMSANEPAWWYGRGALPPREEAPPVALPPLNTPVPTKPTKPVAQFDLFDPASKAETLPLSAELLAKLTTDQKIVLVLLRENGSARASELAERLGKNPGRLNGLMVTLKRALHGAGYELFTAERLPSGETQYRYQAPQE